jgi:histidinol-phosphate aminotransferase
VFAKVPDADASQLFEKLNRASVLVRYWHKPRLEEWLRISIGTPDDMRTLMACLDA